MSVLVPTMVTFLPEEMVKLPILVWSQKLPAAA